MITPDPDRISLITLHHSNELKKPDSVHGGLLKNERSKTEKPHSASEHAKLSPRVPSPSGLRRPQALVGRAATWAAHVPLVMNTLLCCISRSLLVSTVGYVATGAFGPSSAASGVRRGMVLPRCCIDTAHSGRADSWVIFANGWIRTAWLHLEAALSRLEQQATRSAS